MKKNIFLLLIVFHLLSTLAIGGYVHAFSDDNGGTACPIPLAMGSACDNHVITSIGYLISLLAIPLVDTVVLFFVAGMSAYEKTNSDISPPFNLTRQRWRHAFLRGSLLRRLHRWLLVHRGDDDKHPVQVFVFMILSLCHHATIKNSPRHAGLFLASV